LVGAELVRRAGQCFGIPVEPTYDHGLRCDAGGIRLGATAAGPGELLFCPAGSTTLEVVADLASPTRVLILGG
jgi:hypothetical protein